MARVGVPYNISMLEYIKKHGPIEIDEIYKNFGNGIKQIVDMEIGNLLSNALITHDADGKYRAV